MIGWEYPPHNSGGLGVACQGMTEALSEFGQRVYFSLPYRFPQSLTHMQVLSAYDPAWFEAEPDHPPFGSYSTQPTIDSVSSELTVDELHALPQSTLEKRVTEYADRVVAVHDQAQESAVIHAHDWMSFPAAMKLQRQTGKPFIAHVHSTEYDRIPHGSGSPYITQTEYQGLNQADAIVAVSNYTKRLIVDRYLVDPAKIEVIHNGITTLTQPFVRPSFAGKRPLVVFMGRLTMQKGAEYFIRVAQAVVKKQPEALFVVVGDGDQYHSLLLSSAGQQLSSHVLFTGFLRGKQREEILNRADVFVMPSLSEPFGLVALEAAQRDTPVIVSTNSGAKEVLTSARVIDFWDAELMTETILELITDQQVSLDQVRRQHQDLEQVTWQKSASKLRDLYRRVYLGK